jgi:hypothetical protein
MPFIVEFRHSRARAIVWRYGVKQAAIDLVRRIAT